jgi:hypothetical protein
MGGAASAGLRLKFVQKREIAQELCAKPFTPPARAPLL